MSAVDYKNRHDRDSQQRDNDKRIQMLRDKIEIQESVLAALRRQLERALTPFGK